MKIFRMKLSILIFIFLPGHVLAADREVLKQDNAHIRKWNKFAEDVLALHKKLTDGKSLEIKKKVGGYAHQEDFYTEHRYLKGNRLVSKVQWEKDNPEKLHTIEVYLHDQQGRVKRDFMAAYLPFYHNAPNQTLISFHHYNGELHAFRTFDASGDMILERCQGKDGEGEVVNLLLDEGDLYNDPDDIMITSEYKQCFSGLKRNELGKYIIPQ